MDIYKYIEEYGKYTFEDKKINQVDKVIFSFLSYANLEDVFENTKSMTIGDASKKYLKLHPEKDINIMAVKEGNKLLKHLGNSERYKNCILSNYIYVGNTKVQFGVVTIEYMPDHVYVSFEGTDSMFSGWMEDFVLSYQFPTISHKMAIKYLNDNFTLTKKSIIVGGHSKGGNLALVASMYAKPSVKRKIIEVINADGPGLLDKAFTSMRYNSIRKKYTHIMPNYSFVGLFLNHSNDYVVNSTNKSILAHNIVYWEIEEDHFIKTKLSPFSKELDESISKWFSKYNLEDKKAFISNLKHILEEAGVTSILDIKTKKRKLMSLITSSKEMSDHTKKVLIDFVLIIIKCFSEVKKEELKDLLTNMFKITSKTFSNLPIHREKSLKN